MQRDPYYQEITTRLSGQLNPDLFEECAADILRSEFPALVPVRGGSDAGMDGAIADGFGPAFPLVTTTSKEVIGNMTRNLKSYLRDGGLRREVVVATSDQLTARRRRNLEDRASELGFTLVQVYDRSAIADRLYYSPAWCKELLNLDSAPPALSQFPPSRRPIVEIPLVGRTEALEWIRSTPGDTVLYGEPGSGKTFVLYTLAAQGWGYFTTTDQLDRISGDIRRMQPRVLIVDDAHVSPEFLTKLRHLRSEMQSEFTIVASTWPGDRDEVVAQLGISSSQALRLERLTRDEIVEVIQGCGIAGPDGLVQEIVNQSEGLPGLAVTLCQLCKSGAVREVAIGEALNREVSTTFRQLVGDTAMQILACFAVGGEAGMPQSAVANATGLPAIEIHSQITLLAAGGVVHEVKREPNGESIVKVRPDTLREALVRDIFFGGRISPPFHPLFEHAPDQARALETLIGAKHLGGRVDQVMLENLVAGVFESGSLRSEQIARDFAALGKKEALWILEFYPDIAAVISDSLLRIVPDQTLPALLASAVGDERPLHQHPNHPLRVIELWAKSVVPGTMAGPERRERIIETTIAWLREDGDSSVAAQALMLGIAPDFDRHWLKPGSGNVVQLHYGLLPDNELTAISDLWDRALHGLSLIDSVVWKHVVGAVSDWVYPRTRSGPPDPGENTTKLMQAAGLRMLHDLEQYSKDNPALAQWLMEESARADATLDRYVDPDFDILYPSRYFAKDFEEIGRQRRDRAIRLAGEFARREPEQVADTLAKFERSNRDLDAGRGQTLPEFGRALAAAATPLSEWIDAVIAAGAPPAVLDAFIARSCETDAALWESTIERCMANPQYHRLALWSVLTHPAPPRPLIVELCTDPELLHLNLSFLVASDVSDQVIRYLLEYAPEKIASKAVVGLWWKEPQGVIPDHLRASWERALARYNGRDYDLADILRSDSRLGYVWLTTQLSDTERHQDLWLFDKSLEAATQHLSTEQRRELIDQLPNSLVVRDVAEFIVGNDIEAFRLLLSNAELSTIHLAPLATWSIDWIDMAQVAFTAGHSLEDIVGALIYPTLKPRVFSGPESNFWREWIERFDELASSNNQLAQQIAALGTRIASAELDRALIRERDEAVYGWN